MDGIEIKQKKEYKHNCKAICKPSNFSYLWRCYLRSVTTKFSSSFTGGFIKA